MPYKVLKPCAVPGCAGLTSGSYCKRHARQKARRYDKARGSAARRGYGRAWQALRKKQLDRYPYCKDPFRIHKGQYVPATEVDHIKPKAEGGQDVESNLQSLCKSCHSRKTALATRFQRSEKVL